MARSHELVAYARLGPVPRERVERAYWRPRQPTAFEYWSHAACVLPIEYWPYFAFRRRALRARGKRWHQSHERVCAQVLARLQAEGPLTATQLGGAVKGDGEVGGGAWWDWSDTKIAVEWLLDVGEVICVRREGWRRVYDLPERVLPAALLAHDPSDTECLAHLAAVAARGSGGGDPGRPDRLPPAAGNDQPRHQARRPGGPGGGGGRADTGLRRGGGRPCHRRLGRSRGPGAGRGGRPGRHRVTLLSPFDSLVWDRKRTRQMFGFDHSLEAYVPQAKRVHGYYAMPLLAGWSAAPTRCGGARPWSPASCHWPRRRPPGRWPGRCGKRRNGSAAPRSPWTGSSRPTWPSACTPHCPKGGRLS